MWDVKSCFVCFNSNTKLFKLNTKQLRRDFNLVSGLRTTSSDGLLQYLCVECHSYVQRFVQFQKRCHIAYFALQELLNQEKEITQDSLKAVGQALAIKPTLSFITAAKIHYEESKFCWKKQSRNKPSTGDIPVVNYGATSSGSEVTAEPINVIPEVKIETDENAVYENIDDQNCCINKFDTDFEVDGESWNEQNNDHIELNTDADGTSIDEEYAKLIPITVEEAKAVSEIYNEFLNPQKNKCKVCQKGFHKESVLKQHSRMHDRHMSGEFHCKICKYYYKTEFLLKTHMTDKHLYKYLCPKCPIVNFTRPTAKQHYATSHMEKKNTIDWGLTRPNWLRARGVKPTKGQVSKKRANKEFKEIMVYTPVTQEEQYRMVSERKLTRNYIESEFRCELCFRGYREPKTYETHMKKHDPKISGGLMCDMCKLCFSNQRKIYRHMKMIHICKYTCQLCQFFCYCRSQASSHFRFHKNVVYKCPHCDMSFKKLSTRLTHVRVKHPSTYVCNICGHSFVSEFGLNFHKNRTHSKEEVLNGEALVKDQECFNYCAECKIQFVSSEAYSTHFGSSSKHCVTNTSSKPVRVKKGHKNHNNVPRKRVRRNSEIVNKGVATTNVCEVCNVELTNDVQAKRHYETEHPGHELLKRYMCDVCGHTTRMYSNLLVHMRTHTQEKPYECPHCDRRFSMPSNRDRHIVVHTGEKRYQCQHCSRRFTQSSAVKLHIQTVHLKIPYAPWDKKNRKRRKEMEMGTALPTLPTLTPAPAACLPTKLLLETPGDYLNAYITYSDDV